MTPAGIILPQATLRSNGTRCTAKQSDEGCLVRPCTIQPSSTPRTVSHLATPRGLPYSSGVHRSLRFAKERCNRSGVLCRAAATVPSLADLELAPILNENGELSLRATPAGIQASVFAVFDKEHRLQYIGFSKDISRSLMTVFTRRPESAWYYKCVNLQELVQDDMLAIRESWFQEVGGPPSGNKLSLERNKWQLPAEGEFIDGKGFVKAAQDKAEQMLEAIRKRGCKHRFEPVVKMMQGQATTLSMSGGRAAALLQEGKVDLQLAEELSEEEKEARRLELERAARATRTGTAVVDMEEQSFTVYFERVYQTNGGIMCDVIVVYQGVKTSHRVIVGREFYEHLDGLEGEDLVVAAFSLLISKNVPRRTEGILLSSQFPSNYFSISELRQWFSDAEVDAALVKARGAVGELSSTLSVTSPAGGLWKWNRDVHYATIAEDIEALDRAIGPGAEFE